MIHAARWLANTLKVSASSKRAEISSDGPMARCDTQEAEQQ